MSNCHIQVQEKLLKLHFFTLVKMQNCLAFIVSDQAVLLQPQIMEFQRKKNLLSARLLKTEKAKDEYIADNLDKRPSVSRKLGIWHTFFVHSKMITVPDSLFNGDCLYQYRNNYTANNWDIFVVDIRVSSENECLEYINSFFFGWTVWIEKINYCNGYEYTCSYFSCSTKKYIIKVSKLLTLLGWKAIITLLSPVSQFDTSLEFNFLTLF